MLLFRYSAACALLIASAMALAGCVSMSRETAMEEGAFLSLQAVDTYQTAGLARIPGAFEKESAWAIGREPSVRSTLIFMGGAAIAHVAAANYMDVHDWPRWIRRSFEALTIGDEMRCVVGNSKIGVSAGFSYSADAPPTGLLHFPVNRSHP